MSIDPLAEDYTYNSPYAFQENKMGMGRELEGLELVSPILSVEVEFGNTPLLSMDEVIETGAGAEKIAPKATSGGASGEGLFDKLGKVWDELTGSSEKVEAKPKEAARPKEVAKPKEGAAEEKPKSAKENPKKAAREAGKEKRDNQPGSEKRGKDSSRDLKKREGPDAARRAHDAKDKGAPDRTKQQLKEDYGTKW